MSDAEKLKELEERIVVLEELVLGSQETTAEDIYMAYRERCRERSQGARG